jgi:hypothetical protein
LKRLARDGLKIQIAPMSTAVIKASIDRMSEDERFFAAAYLRHLQLDGDLAHQAVLKERLDRMIGGAGAPLEKAVRLDEALRREGF